MVIGGKMYIVLIEDRHADVDVELFQNIAPALARAKFLANEYARDPDDVEVVENKYCVRRYEYSCEGDAVTILDRVIK
jgi:hypothetical protein